MIENALSECQNLIAEKGFIVKTGIAENLPKISADANALSLEDNPRCPRHIQTVHGFGYKFVE